MKVEHNDNRFPHDTEDCDWSTSCYLNYVMNFPVAVWKINIWSEEKDTND